MKDEVRKKQRDYTYDIDWTTLGGYLESLERRGVSPNVASFVGATTVRVHELGEADLDPSGAEIARMQDLVREAMREGALGVGSSLIYAPAYFAETAELEALARAAGESGGGYISHIRNESYRLEQAIDEFLQITRAGGGMARSITSRPRARRTGRAWRRRSRRSSGHAAPGCRCRPTCIPTSPAPPVLMQRCHSGCRREAWTPGLSGSRIPRSGHASSSRCATRRRARRTCF
jgi:hypothetical protein